MTEKGNPDIIFAGKHYRMWKKRVEAALAKEGLQNLLTDKKQEEKYIELDPEERHEKMANYNTKQGNGLSTIQSKAMGYQ